MAQNMAGEDSLEQKQLWKKPNRRHLDLESKIKRIELEIEIERL